MAGSLIPEPPGMSATRGVPVWAPSGRRGARLLGESAMSRSPRRPLWAAAAVVTAAAGLAVASLAGGAPPAPPAARHRAAVPIFLQPSRPPAERAADLVSRMSLDEKAYQMNSSQAPAIPRLFGAAGGGGEEGEPRGDT